MGKLIQPCSSNKKLILTLFLILLLPIRLVYGECTCEQEEEEESNKSEALKYKLVAIASILVAGAIGVCFPMLGKKMPALSPEKNLFFMIKAFAAGVILATGFIHILPEASDRLASPCLSEKPWGEFPFAQFVGMCSAIGTLMVDAFAMSYFNKSHMNKAQRVGGDEEDVQVHVHTHATHGHSHGSTTSSTGDLASSELLRHRVISQVLELGIVVHSVIIGIALGASGSPKTVKPLVAALTFHQFFEGMGLGGCIAQANFRSRSIAIMVVFFSLTTPVGIAIGIGISNVYSENSPTSLIVEGIFDAASAGILIYMALVDLLAADFMSPKIQNNRTLWTWASVSLLLGTGCMSLLAKWA